MLIEGAKHANRRGQTCHGKGPMPKDAAVQGSSFQRSVCLSPGSVSSSHPQNLHHPALPPSLNILKQSYFSWISYSQRTVRHNHLFLLRLKLNAGDWLSWFLLGGSWVCAGVCQTHNR